MGRNKNNISISGGFHITGQSPVDDRLVVSSVADLTTAATWNGNGLYNGMVVAVTDTDELYVLNDRDNVTLSASWTKVGGGDGKGAITAANYTAALALATNDNKGQIIYALADETGHVAGAYIVTGEGSLQHLTTDTGSGETPIERIQALETKVGNDTVSNQIDAKIDALDATVSQAAGNDGLSLQIVEEDGKLVSVTGAIADGTYVKAESGKRLMTDAEGTKLEGIATGAQVNVLEGVKVNGSELTIDANKKVDVTIAEGTGNGTIKVNGTDVNVHGLGSAAYKAEGDFVAAESGKRLMTDAEGTKLEGIATGAQVNVIETVKVDGTALTVTDKAVDITIPKYTIAKSTESGDYASRYYLTKDGAKVGEYIDIPKDMVVESGEVRKLTDAEIAAGKGVADKDYIVLTLANVQPTTEEPFKNKLYIRVDGLVDVYTGGETTTIGVSISDHVITATLKDGAVDENKLESTLKAKINGKVDKSVTGTNGTALIFNEGDGGGSKFEHNNGTEAFAGVNDMGSDATGMGVQLYVDKSVDGTWKGATIKGYNDKFFYQNYDNRTSGKPADSYEIATKGDLPGVATTETVGTVKIGSGINVDAAGTISTDNATILANISAGQGITVESITGGVKVSTKIAGTELGSVKNGGNIEVAADGTMNSIWSAYGN